MQLIKINIVDKEPSELSNGEATKIIKGGPFKGVGIGKDGGYFVYTKKARSKSYNSISEIPEEDVRRVR